MKSVYAAMKICSVKLIKPRLVHFPAPLNPDSGAVRMSYSKSLILNLRVKTILKSLELSDCRFYQFFFISLGCTFFSK